MTAKGKFDVVILWAHEIRIAARALREFEAAMADMNRDDKEVMRLARVALKAAHAALYHKAIDDGSALIVCEDPAHNQHAEVERSEDHKEQS